MKNYVSLMDAAKLVPGQPHVASLWRWCRRGVMARTKERVRLAHVRCGGKIYTTEKDLEEFIEKLATTDTEYFDTQLQKPNKTSPVKSNLRKREIEAAERYLDQKGA